MTSIEQSPCKREVRVQDGNRWKVYVARFAPEGVYMREKGKRTEYGPVSWGLIALRGAQMYANESKREMDFRGTAADTTRKLRRKRVSRNLLG